MNELKYNYKKLYKKTTTTPAYGKYVFLCGDNSSAVKDSNGELCIYDGKISTTDNENTILLMRNVHLS